MFRIHPIVKHIFCICSLEVFTIIMVGFFPSFYQFTASFTIINTKETVELVLHLLSSFAPLQVFVHTRKNGELKEQKWRIWLRQPSGVSYKSLKTALAAGFPKDALDPHKK